MLNWRAGQLPWASSFGLAAAFSVVLLGDESGYSATHTQRMKLAAMEGMWETHEAPASFTLVGLPDQRKRAKTIIRSKFPYAMGLIATRSLTKEIPGINDLVLEAQDRIRSGIVAYDALMNHSRRPRRDRATRARHVRDAWRGPWLCLFAAEIHRRSAQRDRSANPASRG